MVLPEPLLLIPSQDLRETFAQANGNRGQESEQFIENIRYKREEKVRKKTVEPVRVRA
jgi:hypothetical protein